MTKEEKQLLFRDLCVRLPYGVRVKLNGRREKSNKLTIDWLYTYSRHIEDIKPYLRPMSSMTEEEKDFIRNKYFFEDWDSWSDLLHYHCHQLNIDEMPGFMDWLNAHHLDYRGLIERGLALEAQEGMYKN